MEQRLEKKRAKETKKKDEHDGGLGVLIVELLEGGLELGVELLILLDTLLDSSLIFLGAMLDNIGGVPRDNDRCWNLVKRSPCWTWGRWGAVTFDWSS